MAMPITRFAEYQQHADECRLLAFLTTKAKQKAMLEDMARVWEKAAKEYERDLEPEAGNVAHQ
jgi:hypothetical protein